GWAALLGRLSGQEEVVVGSPVANRGRSEIEGLIGFFVNTLALRVDLSGRPTVAQLLQRVKERTLEGQSHQDLPFEQVVEIIQPPRSMAHSPLFQVMFALQNTPHKPLELPGLTASPLEGGHVTAKFDMVLSLVEAGNRISGDLEYATALFERDTAERYLRYWQRLLAAMTANEEQDVFCLPLLPQAERRQVVESWSAPETVYPTGRGVHELFEEQVRERPQALAIIEGGSELSYTELNRRANQLARYLRLKGLEPQGRVAILLERSVELVIAEIAIVKCGAIYVPIDPGFPLPRQALLIRDCQARFLVCTSKTAVPEGLASTCIHIDDCTAAAQEDENLHLPCSGDAAAYVMYTSGSTGIPKGVMVPHVAIERLVRNARYVQFLPTDRVAFASNPAFDAATMEIWGALLNGGAVAVIPQTEKLESVRFVRMLHEQQVTIFFMTTALFNHYAAVLPEAFRGRRAVLVGGDRVDVDAFRQVLSEGAPGHLIHVYGPTETTTFALSYEVRRIEEGATNIPIGQPIGNTQVYVLDGEGEPVPVGVAGELYIGGAGVAQGYLNRPELTAERFVPNPFCKRPGGRLYRTGDLGRWLKDGTIEFLGRNDQQIKIRGYRVELGEIEARLREHAGVREAVVVARGEGAADKRLIAYYTGTEGVRAETLRAHVAEVLPEYMVPSAYVRLEVFPLTQNGKFDSRALPEPESGAYATAEYEPPQGEIEKILAGIWVELLNVERVGRRDNFFELGGHSLLTVKMLERMRQQGLQTDVGSVFAAPTLAGLAAIVDVDSGPTIPANPITEECARITPEMLPLVKLSQSDIDRIVTMVPGGVGNVQDVYPLAPLQEGILFHHLSLTEGDPYLLGSLIRFDSRERLDAYLSAVQKVIDRHDILRTSILWEGLPEAVQVVWRKATLPVVEIEGEPGEPDVAHALRERFNSRNHRMDVSRAPLLHAYIARDINHGGWLLMQLLHHLAGDHTTFEVMLEEIETHLLGNEAQLPPALPFRTLIARARLGITTEQHEAYFRKLLAGVDEPTAPYGLLEVRGDGVEAEMTVDVEPALALRARERARQLGVSAASLFHVAWAQVLALVSGRHDVVFGTVLFGRMQSGTGSDRVMGLFINTLPVRIHVAKQGAADCVRSTHSQLIDLLRHEHASLALAQRCSAVPAPAPLFSALLNYRYGQPLTRSSEEARRVWEGTEYIYGEDRSNYPFSLDVDDLGTGFRLTTQVQHPADPGRICGYMHQALSSLVQALESAATVPVEDLAVLPERDLNRLLLEWNATALEYSASETAHELFEDQVRRDPGALALVCEQRSLTYGDLNRRANRLAHYLRKMGVGPDRRVAICVERNLSML
ncbi:MAG TPA: amino acid adenylation domain-containing protein, partial [Steroidobacteraceae bacterium]